MGVIPLISPNVQPMASLISLSQSEFFTWSRSKLDVIIIGENSLDLKNEYLTKSSRGFNSRDAKGEVIKHSEVEHKPSN